MTDTFQTKILCNIYGEQFNSVYGGNIYDKNYLSPCLTVAQGGGRTPIFVEIKNDKSIRKADRT